MGYIECGQSSYGRPNVESGINRVVAAQEEGEELI